MRFLNTVWADRTAVHDDLRASADVQRWLREVGWGVRDVGADDVRRLRDLRDALRSLAAVATGDTRPRAASPVPSDEAVRTVNDALRLAPAPRLAIEDGAVILAEPADGSATSALAALAAEGAELLTKTPASLRACHAPGCVLYFVLDHPRREWCSTTCGNRARAARHYARRRGAAGS